MEVWELHLRVNKPTCCRIPWCTSMWTAKGKHHNMAVWPIPRLEAPITDLFSVLLSSSSDRPYLCYFKKLIIEIMPSCSFQSDEWCQWGRLHAHSWPSLRHRHEKKLAWRHYAGPTKPLGTQTVSIKEEKNGILLLYYYVNTSNISKLLQALVERWCLFYIQSLTRYLLLMNSHMN